MIAKRHLSLALPANSYLVGFYTFPGDNVTCSTPSCSYIAEFFIYSVYKTRNCQLWHVRPKTKNRSKESTHTSGVQNLQHQQSNKKFTVPKGKFKYPASNFKLQGNKKNFYHLSNRSSHKNGNGMTHF